MRVAVLFITGLVAFHLSAYSQTVTDYLKIAEEHNPGLQSIYHEYEASIQKINQAGILPDPFISGSYALPLKRMDMPFTRSNITAMQMLPWFGALKAERNTAVLSAGVSYQYYRNARNELFFKVKSAYYPLLEIVSQLKLLQENIKILQTYKTLTTSALSNGKGTMIEVLRVDIIISEAETELKILELKIKSMKITFKALLNIDDEIHVPDSITIEGFSDRNVDSLGFNPKIKALESKYQEAKAEEVSIVKNNRPQFTLGLSYQQMTNLEQNKAMGMVMPMVGMTLPVYRKKYNGAIKESQSLQKAYQQMKRDVSNSIAVDYENALFEINKADEMIKLYILQCKKTETIIRLMLVAYSNSGENLEDILKMQQEILRYKNALISAKKEYAMANAAIAYALGESEN